ncbi:hypothetical protein ACF08W_34580 [Streptomyces sp. NPDC015144]|uniref:hypothetical protein n=1 Tax=Streptomyces sp. NPDC015144 TaxID=3364944 RepID=UPI0036FF0263
MDINFREGPEASITGGTDVVISLTPQEARAIGGELGPLADAMSGALWALAILRTGQVPADQDAHPDARPTREATPATWATAIADLDQRLMPRLQGIRDAAVRAHTNSGGSVGGLARAMGVASRSTAQYRRDTLQDTPPSPMEIWATTGTTPGD